LVTGAGLQVTDLETGREKIYDRESAFIKVIAEKR